MANARSDIAGRWCYAVEAALLGLPSIVVCIPLLLMGLMLLAATFANPRAIGEMTTGSLLLFPAILMAGVAGIGAWFVLSGHYLMGGRKGLKQVDSGWWCALGAGAVLALVVAYSITSDGWNGADSSRYAWLAGPALLLPSVHLAWARMSR